MATTTTTANPWEPIQPYLIGGKGTTPGIVDQAAAIYGQQAAMPDYLKNAYNSTINLGMGYGNSQGSQMINQNAQNILAGAGAPRINPVAEANVARYGDWASAGPAARGEAASANAAQARFDLGNLGMGSAPMDAYSRMLSGKADTTTLDPVVNNATRRLTDNFNEQVLPGLRHGAQVAGQFGSSRQGIAEGLAAKGLALGIGDMTGNMYNSAYNNAQNMMQNAAGQLGGFSTNIANNNAQMQTQINAANAAAATQASLANAAAQNNMRQFNANSQNQMGMFNVAQANQGNQFNANLGLQNNAQAMQDYNNKINAANMGAGMLQNNANTAMNLGLNATNAANNANNYNWQQLGNYQNTILPAAGLGGSQQTPYYTNPLATGVGAAVGAAKVWDAVSGLWK